MSKPTITNHLTGPMNIKFMAVARPFKNIKSGKSEFSIKGWLDASDEAVAHLTSVAEYKVDTKTNRNLEDKSSLMINFTTNYEPKVYNVDGVELLGNDIPFYDGRIDKGSAVVSYNLIDYGDTSIVRLTGVKLLSLNLAPREEGGATTSEIENLLKTSG